MAAELETAPAIYRLAYETAAREHAQQQEVLESVRTRAGLVLSAASVAVGFLAGQAITPGPDPRGWIVGAILLYLAGATACVWIVLPRGSFSPKRRAENAEGGSAFEFNHNIPSWLEAAEWAENGDAYAYEHVARSLYGQRRRNEARLDRLLNVMAGASVALGLSIVCWLLALRGR